MKKLLFIFLLTSPCLASSPKYKQKDPVLQNEIVNIYKSVDDVLKGNVRISSVTIGTATFSNAISSLTVSNFSVTGTYSGISLSKVVQTVSCTGTTSTSITSATAGATVVTCSITPTSASNRIEILAVFMSYVPVAAGSGIYYFSRGTTKLSSGPGMIQQGDSGVTFTTGPLTPIWIDSPATTSSTSYTIYGKNENGVGTITVGNGYDWFIILREVV